MAQGRAHLPSRHLSVPRLLVLTSTFPAHRGDGTPAFVSDLAAYESRDFDTLVLTPRIPHAPRSESLGERLRVERFPYLPERWETLAHGAILENIRNRRGTVLQVPALMAAQVLAVRRAVRSFRPHVVHAHWIVPQGVVAIIAARGIPLVVTTHGGDVYGLRSSFWRLVHGTVLRRASAITTVNRDMHGRVLELGADPARTTVIPMGTDTGEVTAVGTDVVPQPGRILVIGRLVEKKGVHVLLDALRLLPSQIEWSLDVVGDGPLRTALESRAAGLPVRFRGQLRRKELLRSLHEAQVVVAPSVPAASGDQDGLPVALLEAIAAGRAVVASRLPGIDEAISHGENGLLVAAGDRRQLADAIASLLSDEASRRRLGAQARASAATYSIDAIGSRYVGLLRGVVGP